MNNEPLRPDKLSDIVGNEGVLRRLNISINASKMRKEPCPHICLYGPPGTGKTTIAYCVANALGGNLIIANASTLQEPKDLFQSLKSIERGDCFFVDEIHQLPRKLEDFLLTIMESFRMDMPYGSNRNKVISSYDLECFTLLGATTDFGLCAPALRDRFRFKEELSLYTAEELSKIIIINSKKLGCSINEGAANGIAIRSRGTPRVANNLLMWVRDYAQSHGNEGINLPIVEQAMNDKGIDEKGLLPVDRRYIKVLFDDYSGGPAGINTLAATLNTIPETLSDSVEPYLMQVGLLARSSSGRVLTGKGLEYGKQLVRKA